MPSLSRVPERAAEQPEQPLPQLPSPSPPHSLSRAPQLMGVLNGHLPRAAVTVTGAESHDLGDLRESPL